ncbi:hypothetical protein JL722_6585 [Aureococcus anophagefferens]|nr:hypothetical protein JL722_6585 [Aureococcus anophagefferens]
MRWLALACACRAASDEVVISYEGSIDANLGGLGNRLLGLISAKMFADLARARFAVVDERFTGLARFSERSSTRRRCGGTRRTTITTRRAN